MIEIQDGTVTSSTPNSGLTYADLIQIVELLRQSEQFSSFRLKTPELELEVLREGAPLPSTMGKHGPAAASLPAPTPAAAVEAAPMPGPPAPTTMPAEQPGATVRPSNWQPVTSPMVGTFYAAPEPGAAPFVRPGQAVRAGDVLCIIEVMKLMNTLRAEFDGTVREIAVRDAQAVEYGQVLMQVEPA